MSNLVWFGALLIGILMGGPHTLREELQDAGIPLNSFSEGDLNQKVDSLSAVDDGIVYFVYILRNGGELTGKPHLVRYDTSKGALLRAEVKPADDDRCCGSPEGIDFVDDFLLLTFHINPSAASVVVLNGNLEAVKTLYGFGIDRIAPDQVVFTGSMVHFAPTHAERLNFVDLRIGKVSELYPSGNDPFRTKFIDEHRKRMPSQDVCRVGIEQGTDPCAPNMFDESVSFLGSDGNGGFAIAVDRDASHAPAKNQRPVSVLSEAALYLYVHGTKGWVYCQQKISDSESKSLNTSDDENLYPKVKDRCTPNLPVVPDSYN